MPRQSRQQRHDSKRSRKQADRFPELFDNQGFQDHFEATLEREANKTRFGKLEARNEAQGQMMATIDSRRLIFVDGPAGTGKTFVSTSMAVEMLEAGKIERIVIARPMVGCDEEMGFLPGDEDEKYRPWLEPFFDVLEGKLGKKKVETYLKYKKIVARPLMMMRGVTFRNAFIILDEAQNVTKGQMKMFLTRIGSGSKIVIDGDVEQTDLPANKISGLPDAIWRFKGTASAGFISFTEDDIERDPLVRDIVLAYRRNS